MKKIILPVLALAAALTVSCNKEQGTDSPAAKTRKATIEASIDGTKTYYANDKTFTWLAGDEISVMEELDGEVKFDVFTATAEGRATSFDGEISEGATFGKWAVYPATLEPTVDEAGVLSFHVQHGSVQDIDPANPLKYLPLVGQKQEDGKYKFSTAMGVVKFSFTNVPANVAYFNITAKEPVWGIFSADEDGTVKLDNFSEGDSEPGYSWWDVVPNEDGTLDVYVPMPVGTLTAGMKVWLEDVGVNTLFSITTAKDIEVVRNRVTELAPVALPSSSLTLEDIYGIYEVLPTSYWDGELESAYLVIEPSDNEDNGNVMFTTNFLGWPIDVMYGSFNTVNGDVSVPPQYIYQDDGTYADYFSYLILATIFETEDGLSLDFANMVLQFDEPGVFHLAGEGYPAITYDLFEEDWGVYEAYTALEGVRIADYTEVHSAPGTKAVKSYQVPFSFKSRQTVEATKVPLALPARAEKKIVKLEK